MKKLTINEMIERITRILESVFHVTPEEATDEHYYKAVALICSEIMSNDYTDFKSQVSEEGKKTVYYLCMEFAT